METEVKAIVVLLLLVANLLAACGQKGPLYLPPEPERKESR